MHADRPYRKGLQTEIVLEELRKEAGKQFDPWLVNIFIENELYKIDAEVDIGQSFMHLKE